MNRLEEVMARIGSRPALIHMASAGDYFGENAPYQVESGVAIINITGPLSNADWSWRGTTYGEIQDQCRIAVADPNVRGILLNVNSPGGETDNAFETAGVIAEAAQQKPVWAVANTAAYSAAYLLASQAAKIYCVPTSGGAGSIGVYCAHFDMSEMLKQQGVKVTLISAGTGKTDGNPYEPLSKTALANMQMEIDRLYGEFVDCVATGRGLKATDIVKLGARCVEGSAAAIAAGLADMPGDLSVALTDLCNDIQRAPLAVVNGRLAALPSSAASAANSKEDSNMADQQQQPAAEAKIPTDAEVQAMIEQARTEGFSAAAEIVELCAIAGSPAKAQEFITAKTPVADVRKSLIDTRAAGVKGTELETGVMPGQDAKVAADKQQGKASPWGELLTSMGLRKKESK